MLIVAITSSWAITPVTKTYGSNTFLDVTNTTKNVTVGTTNYVTLLRADFSGAWYTGGTSNTGNVSGNFNAETMPGFFGDSGWNAAYTIRQASGYNRPFFVTGTTGVAILGNDNSSSDANKKLNIVVEEVAENGDLTSVGSTAGTGNTSVYVLEYTATTLAADKYYKITITATGANTGNNRLAQIRFTQPSSTPAGPVDPDFSLSADEVEVGSTISVNGPAGLSFNAEPVSGTTGAVSVSGGTITGVTAGAAQVRVTSAATSEYNAYDHTFGITVTAPVCATPVISPATFTADNQEVTITSATDGATIYYTTDGTDPTESSNEYNPESKPTISSTTTFKAIAVKENYDDSEVATQKVTRTSSAVVASWDFTNWSSETIAGTGDDTGTWYDHEKSDGTGVDFTNGKGAVNKATISSAAVIKYGTTEIEETKNLKFKADAYQFALVYDVPSALNTYHGSQYIWLFKKASTITIPSVPAGATIEIGVETHKNTEARGVTLTNGSTELTQTQGEETSTAYQVCKWTNISTAGDVVITPTAGLHIYYIKVTGNVETEGITTDNGVATYVTQNALDFTGLETKAYVVTGTNSAKTKVLTEEVTTVPAGTPLLVKGATVNVPVIANATAPATNLFQISNGSVVQNTDKTIFVYSKTAKAFKRLGTATIPNGKCYINIEGVPEATQSLDVDIEGEATAITNVNANENANSAAPVKIIKNGKLYIGNYNVAGQQVK